MYLVAAKAGLGFVLFLAILGAVQAQSLSEPLLLFVTVGLVPGTNFELPAEFMLLAVGGMLMALTILFFRHYYAFHNALDAIMPEYLREDLEDPDFTSLVPGLDRLTLAGQSAINAANEASVELYFWLRSFGRPAIAQAVTARRGIGASLVRMERWSSAWQDTREGLEKATEMGRRMALMAKEYMIRLSIF